MQTSAKQHFVLVKKTLLPNGWEIYEQTFTYYLKVLLQRPGRMPQLTVPTYTSNINGLHNITQLKLTEGTSAPMEFILSTHDEVPRTLVWEYTSTNRYFFFSFFQIRRLEQQQMPMHSIDTHSRLLGCTGRAGYCRSRLYSLMICKKNITQAVITDWSTDSLDWGEEKIVDAYAR